MKKRYPFKFLDAYTKEDVDIFFGREEEINALYEMVFQTNLLLVYGASGTGKTSLIQCGLASRFKSHDWLAINIRRGNNINQSLEKALTESAKTEDELNNKPDTEDYFTDFQDIIKGEKPLSDLEKLFKTIYLKYFRPVYLIFDQFEELYILGSEDEQRTFIQTVGQIMRIEQPVKLIISIREEYLGHLFEFEKAVPQLMHKKLRVESMNLKKVRKVIKGVTDPKKSIVTINASEVKEFEESVFQLIKSSEKNLTFQLTYLQVFLDKLYITISGDETREKEALFSLDALNEVGDIEDVLRDFLEEEVKRIYLLAKERYNTITINTIWKILSPFATLEGTKEPISKQDLYNHLRELDQELILVVITAFADNARILKYSVEHELYELVHDSLALRISEKRTDDEIALLEVKRLIKTQVSIMETAREDFTSKQLDFIDRYSDKISPSEKEKAWIEKSRKKVNAQKIKRKRRLWFTFSGLVLLLIIVSGLLIWALDQQKKTKDAYTQLKFKRSEANAKELKSFGDSYLELKKKDFASQSYKAALDTLKDYPEDSLYKKIEKCYDSCKK